MRDAVNFSAGPAGLPTPALERAHDELLDYQGYGASIMELSHRGRHYDAVHKEALALVRSLLAVPDSHEVILLQGGATSMFGLVPMNFLSDGASADYLMTGVWSDKAIAEARCIGQAREAGDGRVDGAYVRVPTQSELNLDDGAKYLHFTTNNTIVGSQFAEMPAAKVPLVADMSSDIMSRPIDFAPFGLVYAGAQKNLGPSGVVMVIASKAMLAAASTKIPKIFRFGAHAEKGSLLHTPPTFAIYLVRNVLAWIDGEGGVPEMARRNALKAQTLYAAIDASGGFYRGLVEPASRSRMNVVFKLPTSDLDQRFAAEAEASGLIGLAGHRSVGGIRASLYNAVPQDGVERLTDFMKDFQDKHG